MLGVLFSIVVIAVSAVLIFFIIRVFIHLLTDALKEKKNTYRPYDEISDDVMKTYKEWCSLDYNHQELKMTKAEWLENSNEKLITKADYESSQHSVFE